jgi:HAD superfamily hydrolase (TIGR01509 family)
MARPRAILLDVMGTLVEEPFLAVVPRALGMSLAELREAKHPTAWIEFEKGLIDEATFRARFFADGRSYDHEGMVRALVDAYAWIDGVEAVCAELARAGWALHLLSNYPVWYRLIERKLHLSRYAAWTFVSCETGVRKPDPEAYLGAARALGAATGELVFVDDREANCRAAAGLGLDAIRFVDARRLREELFRRAIL